MCLTGFVCCATDKSLLAVFKCHLASQFTNFAEKTGIFRVKPNCSVQKNLGSQCRLFSANKRLMKTQRLRGNRLFRKTSEFFLQDAQCNWNLGHTYPPHRTQNHLSADTQNHLFQTGWYWRFLAVTDSLELVRVFLNKFKADILDKFRTGLG